ncbi:MAG TPA: metal-dependent transcriptional regulator [Solirubrobacteraceae bacterium]|nr:metal-dependent transcriptional regulator [Solirubrobacteraceae bacterium]
MADAAHHAHASGGPGTAVENYAKAIYTLQSRSAGAVSTGALASRLGVTASSASAMTRKLHRLGVVEHNRFHGVRLTERGARIALKVIRKHRLLELYLVESLGVPWDRVHRDAEVLEHHLSDELAALIAEKLNQPTHDPHGDPIPTADGKIDEGETVPLETLEPGARGTFVRVSDSDPAMLRYLAEHGIAPGAHFEILDRQPFGGPLSVRFANSIEALGGGLARAMRVELQGHAGADQSTALPEETRS